MNVKEHATNKPKKFSEMLVSKDDLVVSDTASPEEVLKSAYIQNTALAFAENDLAPDGTYPVYTFPPEAPVEDAIMFQVVVVKTGKAIQIGFRVNQDAERYYAQVLQGLHRAYEAKASKFKSEGLDLKEHYVGPKHDVPAWIHFQIMLENEDLTELEYDRIIYKEYPQLWIAKHVTPQSQFII